MNDPNRYYVIDAQARYFEYTDGHFAMTSRIPYGHAGIAEALRALKHANTITDGCKLVQLETVIIPVSVDVIQKAHDDDLIEKFRELFSPEDRGRLINVLTCNGPTGLAKIR